MRSALPVWMAFFHGRRNENAARLLNARHIAGERGRAFEAEDASGSDLMLLQRLNPIKDHQRTGGTAGRIIDGSRLLHFADSQCAYLGEQIDAVKLGGAAGRSVRERAAIVGIELNEIIAHPSQISC
ncbi:hypothetical protein [Rhizobium giardinii]|uniref:Uncharacterized protein n=1 Tax=Rhizobium giardinii TaxID=56731 RepID=A0A7W8X906_9HYPH|nr:hypothetical protein [Rhizobium giardinii]MBB5536196.1 hypothetical protein [Rhizobium giardinii]